MSSATIVRRKLDPAGSRALASRRVSGEFVARFEVGVDAPDETFDVIAFFACGGAALFPVCS
jgi:hypothetical protein